MTWHTVIVSPGELAEALNDIDRERGTLTSYTRESDGIHLIWTTQTAF